MSCPGAAAASFAVATAVYVIAPDDEVNRLGESWFWLLVALVLAVSKRGLGRVTLLSSRSRWYASISRNASAAASPVAV